MTTNATAVVLQKDKSFTQILRERDTALLDIKFTLKEFSSHIEVT